MEPERSLTRLQQPIAYPRAHPDESSQRKYTSNPTVAALHQQTLMDIAKHLADDVYAPLKKKHNSSCIYFRSRVTPPFFTYVQNMIPLKCQI